MERRQQIQTMYIRVCKDAGFGFEPERAAQIAAACLGIHPFEILSAIGYNNMCAIANGTHPILDR